MTEANQALLIHVLCVVAIGGCVALAYLTPGAAGWLYGKLTGKPAPVILNRIVANMDPDRIEQIISTHPPAPEVKP